MDYPCSLGPFGWDLGFEPLRFTHLRFHLIKRHESNNHASIALIEQETSRLEVLPTDLHLFHDMIMKRKTCLCIYCRIKRFM